MSTATTPGGEGAAFLLAAAEGCRLAGVVLYGLLAPWPSSSSGPWPARRHAEDGPRPGVT